MNQPDAPVRFTDDEGRAWHLRILWGHPAPSELGIQAAAFDAVDDPSEPQRIGFIERAWLDPVDEEALRDALDDADPAA